MCVKLIGIKRPKLRRKKLHGSFCRNDDPITAYCSCKPYWVNYTHSAVFTTFDKINDVMLEIDGSYFYSVSISNLISTGIKITDIKLSTEGRLVSGIIGEFSFTTNDLVDCHIIK